METRDPLVYEASKGTEQRSLTLLRTIGCFILIFSLLDFLGIALPIHLLDPIWEFNTIGKFVEMIWSPLLGYFLVFFYIEKNEIRLKQARLLNFLSWIALVMSIFYFALFPLVLSDIFKLNTQLSSKHKVQSARFDTGAEQVRKYIFQATNPEQLAILSEKLKLGDEAILHSGKSLDVMKTEISQKLVNDAIKYRKMDSEQYRGRMIEFYKRAIKYTLGTFISGVCMFIVWRLTRWSRVIYTQLKKVSK